MHPPGSPYNASGALAGAPSGSTVPGTYQRSIANNAVVETVTATATRVSEGSYTASFTPNAQQTGSWTDTESYAGTAQ